MLSEPQLQPSFRLCFLGISGVVVPSSPPVAPCVYVPTLFCCGQQGWQLLQRTQSKEEPSSRPGVSGVRRGDRPFVLRRLCLWSWKGILDLRCGGAAQAGPAASGEGHPAAVHCVTVKGAEETLAEEARREVALGRPWLSLLDGDALCPGTKRW